MTELVDLGAPLNQRVKHQTALLYHLERKNVTLAIALLENGADPTHVCTCGCGFDAALMAVATGAMDFLIELREFAHAPWRVDWERTCRISCKLEGKEFLVSGENALHLPRVRARSTVYASTSTDDF